MPDVFNMSIPHLREWSRRQAVDHRQQNEPVEAINRMMTGVGPPRQVIGRAGAAAAIFAVAQFRLTQSAADFPDHLVCRTWDGITLGDADVLVAKPWELRRTSYDGRTEDGITYRYTTATMRTASKPHPSVPEETISEEQMILPRYVVNGVLFAASPIERGTGVILGDGIPVIWLANDTRRAWAGVFA